MAYPSACSLPGDIGCREAGHPTAHWFTQARKVSMALGPLSACHGTKTLKAIIVTSCRTPGQHTPTLRKREMCEIENVTILNASPATVWSVLVWSVLTDFSDYENRRPLVQLSGKPALGATIDVIIRVGPMKKTFANVAGVTRILRPNEFAWTAGMGRILGFEDAYTLSADKAGTQLRHQIRFFGVLANLWCRLMRRRMLTVLIDADASLQRHLAGANMPPTANRHARRQHHTTKHKRKRGR